MNSKLKRIVFWLVILLSAVLFWQVVKSVTPGAEGNEIYFSEFMQQAGQGNIASVAIHGAEVTGTYHNPERSRFRTTVPPNYPDMYELLLEKGVEIRVSDTQTGSLSAWLLNLAPLLLLAALWFFMLRRIGRPRP